MALDKATLKSSIKAALLAAIGAEDAEEAIATAFSNAIDTFIKSGQVDAGIACAVDPGTHTGATTATGTIS